MMLRFHRYLSLGIGLVWTLKILTGLALTFHWEVDDALVQALHGPSDFGVIEQHVAHIEKHNLALCVVDIRTSGGAADRYDIHADNPETGKEMAWRADGAGQEIDCHGRGIA